MIVCPVCTKENRDEARYCRNCGSALIAAAEEAAPLEEIQELPPAAAEVAFPASVDELANQMASAKVEPGTETASAQEVEASAGAAPNEAAAGAPLPPPGSILAGRYLIHRSNVNVNEAEAVALEVEDLLECRTCEYINSDPNLEYCENCGTRLAPGPVRQMSAYPALANEDSAVSPDEIAFEGWIYRLVAAEAEAPPDPAETALHPPALLVAGYQSDPGKRLDNEDSLLSMVLNGMSALPAIPALGLFAVADGVGGHAGGEIASQAALRALAAGIMQNVFMPLINGTVMNADEIEQSLVEGVQQANAAILGLRGQDPSNDMGSTLTAALICSSQAFIANLGDSRTYLARQGRLEQITQDHSLVARLAQEGLIQPEQIYTHEQRNVIYRSLGEKPDPEVDVYRLDLQPGDRLLLCSDGLWESLRDGLIEETLLANYDPQQASDSLVRLARIGAGDDNISVIVINASARPLPASEGDISA